MLAELSHWASQRTALTTTTDPSDAVSMITKVCHRLPI
jgi:hypothetical protein